MLSESELDAYLIQHGVSPAGRTYIEDTINNAPARLVGQQGGNNVCTSYVSMKCGHTIQTESHTAEQAFAIEYEYDDSVIAYYDQPQPIYVNRTNKNGVVRTGTYTADFLVLTTSGPRGVEVKKGEDIAKLLEKRPADWISSGETVTFRPAHEAFEKIGLPYRVLSADSISPLRTANLKLLLNARTADKRWEAPLKQSVMKIMSQQSWLRLSDLAKNLELKDLTPLIQMVDAGIIFASLDTELLSKPESIWIAKSPKLLALCQETMNNEVDAHCESIEFQKAPSERQATRALAILSRIKAGEQSRSVRRWKKKIKDGKEIGLTEFQSLLPQYYRSGNRDCRLSKTSYDFIQQFIKDQYSSKTRLMPCRAYDVYKVQANEAHPDIPPVSRTTLRKYIKKANQKLIAKGRGGKRAANAAASPSDVKDRAILSTQPFQLASLDHYQADIECVIARSNGKTYTARPWITVLIDVETKAILAMWISFRHPSSRACGMVLRMCAKNHGRLPKAIIVDRGSDFQSVYFFSLLANFGVDLVSRPASHPRYGSEVERIFLCFKTQWLNMRPGNCATYIESRSVSGTYAPTNSAELTIEKLWDELNEYITWKNCVVVSVEMMPPIERLNTALEMFPFLGVKVVFDEAFKIQTAVDVKSYKLDPTRGIHINGLHYWSPELMQIISEGKKVNVRIEPENPYHIYAQIKGGWVSCYASKLKQFNALDPVSRLAEAVRILDGRKTRDIAKEEANQTLAKRAIKADKALTAEYTVIDEPEKMNANDDLSSIFDRLRTMQVEKIQYDSTEV